MNPSQAWQAVVGQLQMEMPKATFDTWVRDAQFLKYDQNTFVVGLKNAYARDWVENRLTSTIARNLTGIMNQSVDLQFVIAQPEEHRNGYHHEEAPAPATAPETPDRNPSLAAKYTFENFVVGANNRLAHAASLAVAENPARAYNPLFLYGGVGLGKTHLLHAIGNTCTANGAAVLYVSSEEFTNDLINAIRSHTTQVFRDKYRAIDVLLIDDIQFIAGKESTQEEFFHTFNTLHSQDKQIVISSDRPPKAMNTLEERLRSRFEWGLTADIQAPDLETRLAILRFKAEQIGRTVPNEILDLIARRMQSNIRELEGALTRILAYSDLRGLPLTVELVNTALSDMLPRQRQLQPDHIIHIVAGNFGISEENILGRDRSRQIALPRQVAMYLMREEARISLPQIGEALGGRDHTTVMYGCDKITDLMERDHHFRRQVLEIKEQLYGLVRAA
ncbi:MAG TPA: chromosomal replication initiator protein DnaA [Anaerolineales bacterium]|nr:chromosomal replication initiator protein DnaA [Anaerolineales bacterium]